MIGYYAHHVGHGHVHRAMSICAHLNPPATILSSRQQPAEWSGSWVQLPRDDTSSHLMDPTAGGQLHWAPVGDRGLQDRMAVIASWIERHRPAAMVVDLSVEVAALCRLIGVPVVTMVLPGERSDRAHQLGYSLSDAIVAPWSACFPRLCPQLTDYGAKVHYVGAISRFDSRSRPRGQVRERRRVLILRGSGGSAAEVDIDAAAAATEGWAWSYLGPGSWSDDPWGEITRADVVVSHAGFGALAEIAAARVPAIVIPQARPHDEQTTTAATLDAVGLAVVRDRPPPAHEWPELLDAALALGGDRWQLWSSGHGAQAAARIVSAVAEGLRFGT